MIFYCTEDGRFWSLYPTTRQVVRAPARLCPTCAKVVREDDAPDEEILNPAQEYAAFLASMV